MLCISQSYFEWIFLNLVVRRNIKSILFSSYTASINLLSGKLATILATAKETAIVQFFVELVKLAISSFWKSNIIRAAFGCIYSHTIFGTRLLKKPMYSSAVTLLSSLLFTFYLCFANLKKKSACTLKVILQYFKQPTQNRGSPFCAEVRAMK